MHSRAKMEVDFLFCMKMYLKVNIRKQMAPETM
jgi:hypothetical protein